MYKPFYTVEEVLLSARSTIARYPVAWQQRQKERLPQFAQELHLVARPGAFSVDLGGGDGFRSAICCALGMRAVSVDLYPIIAESNDYLPDGFLADYCAAEAVSRELGVEFEYCDATKWRPQFENLDVVMSFDAMEHMHHSPRTCFRELAKKLKIGGTFLIGVPNAANLLKRFRVLFGGNAFSRFEDWYHPEYFGGHVREPTAADLEAIGKDLGLSVTIFGRNWLGLDRLGRSSVIGRIIDHCLRPFPSLCSDIYLHGIK